jgi:hypothetical protein
MKSETEIRNELERMRKVITEHHPDFPMNSSNICDLCLVYLARMAFAKWVLCEEPKEQEG